jgi:metal-responsive CopG/Arc/MetJ family transcriptional regulator
MARLSVSIPPEILNELKKEAKKKDIPVATLVRFVLAQRVWRKKSRKDKQHWLEAIYAGKARRKIKEFEDRFSE